MFFLSKTTLIFSSFDFLFLPLLATVPFLLVFLVSLLCFCYVLTHMFLLSLFYSFNVPLFSSLISTVPSMYSFVPCFPLFVLAMFLVSL